MHSTLSPAELLELFVLQQQQWTMVSLGKIQNPMTGELSRDLEQARFSIDLLAMLEEKTKGNLSDREARLLAQVLTNLRLNFVEESARPVVRGEGEPDSAPAGPAQPGTLDTSGDTT